MGAGGTVHDLAFMEHSYAPPYSAAKDPVNMLGFMAENVISGQVAMIGWKDLEEMEQETVSVLDVRTPEEFGFGSVDGAINIELDSLRGRLDEIPRGKTIVLCCEAGLRAYIASRILTQNGFRKVFDLAGGYSSWLYATQRAHYTGPSNPKTRGESGIDTVDISTFTLSEVFLTLRAVPGKQREGDQVVLTARSNPGNEVRRLVTDFCQINGHEVEENDEHDGIWSAVIISR
jgi:rhodanese-related sulfurtransferase